MLGILLSLLLLFKRYLELFKFEEIAEVLLE